MTRIPIYKTVYCKLKQDIKVGIYPPGSLIPCEQDLEKKYNVSRTTIRKVVSLLTNEGYLKPKQGYGTEVMNISTTQRLNKITSISETLTQAGYTVSTQGMFISKLQSPEYISELLDIPVGSEVYKIERVQYADDSPIAFITNYLRASMVPDLADYINTFSSLYAFLESHYHITLTSAEEKLSAISASFTDAQILKIAPGTPLLLSKRLTYVDSTPFEYSFAKLSAQKYEYSVYLTGR